MRKLVLPEVPTIVANGFAAAHTQAPAQSIEATETLGAILWLPSPDDLALLRAVVNDPDAATNAFLALKGRALHSPKANMLWEASRAIFDGGNTITPEALAKCCNAQSAQSEFESVASEWRECAQIALSDLATLPAMADMAKGATEIAKRLAKAPQFHFLTLSDVLSRPEPAFLVERLLTVGGTSLLTAKHASFKSFFALDIALSVALGRKFHDLQCRQGRVVYVAAEGASGLKKRAAAWLQHHEASAPANLVILDRPFQVADSAQRAEFVAVTASLKPQLIVIDTLARCSVGLEENSAGDMGKFADALGDLARETGAHVLCLHHNNKLGEFRGSTALPAAVDTHLTLERHTESDSVTLKTEKQKDAEELAPLTFEKIEVSLANTGGLGHSIVFGLVETVAGSQWRLSQTEQKVLDELANAFGEAGATASQWQNVCEGAGISKRNFYYAKNKLMKENIRAVVCPDDKKKGAIYTVSPDWCKGAK